MQGLHQTVGLPFREKSVFYCRILSDYTGFHALPYSDEGLRNKRDVVLPAISRHSDAVKKFMFPLKQIQLITSLCNTTHNPSALLLAASLDSQLSISGLP